MELASRFYHSEGSIIPPAIVLHGLLGSAANWHAVSRALSQFFDVHVLDLRNHGESPHSAEMSYESMAADVLRYMDHHNITKGNLIGHSLGGKVAMEIALTWGDRVQALVVEDMTPFKTDERNRFYVELLKSLPLGDISSRKDAERYLAKQVSSRTMVLFLLKNFVRNADGSYQWRVNLPSILENYDKLWSGLAEGRRWSGATLFISGGKSDYVHPDELDHIRELFPAAIFSEVADAGHWIHAEFKEAFCSQVVTFVKNA